MWLNKFFSKGKPEKTPTAWFVIFTPSTQFEWWNIFTKHRKNFDHVCALQYDRRIASWILVDWSSYGLWVNSLSNDEVDYFLGAAIQNRWPMVKYSQTVYKVPIVIGPYCVSAIKHLMGVNTLAFTPYQLYKDLKKRGAKDVFEEMG